VGRSRNGCRPLRALSSSRLRSGRGPIPIRGHAVDSRAAYAGFQPLLLGMLALTGLLGAARTVRPCAARALSRRPALRFVIGTTSRPSLTSACGGGSAYSMGPKRRRLAPLALAGSSRFVVVVHYAAFDAAGFRFRLPPCSTDWCFGSPSSSAIGGIFRTAPVLPHRRPAGAGLVSRAAWIYQRGIAGANAMKKSSRPDVWSWPVAAARRRPPARRSRERLAVFSRNCAFPGGRVCSISSSTRNPGPGSRDQADLRLYDGAGPRFLRLARSPRGGTQSVLLSASSTLRGGQRRRGSCDLARSPPSTIGRDRYRRVDYRRLADVQERRWCAWSTLAFGDPVRSPPPPSVEQSRFPIRQPLPLFGVRVSRDPQVDSARRRLTAARPPLGPDAGEMVSFPPNASTHATMDGAASIWRIDRRPRSVRALTFDVAAPAFSRPFRWKWRRSGGACSCSGS